MWLRVCTLCWARFPGRQTRRRSFARKRFNEVLLGSTLARGRGQQNFTREKKCKGVTTETSGTGSSENGMALYSCPELMEGGQAFVPRHWPVTGWGYLQRGTMTLDEAAPSVKGTTPGSRRGRVRLPQEETGTHHCVHYASVSSGSLAL